MQKGSSSRKVFYIYYALIIDIENKELTIEDVQRYTEKYEEIDIDDENNKEDRSETPDSAVSWDIVINNAELFLKGLIGVRRF